MNSEPTELAGIHEADTQYGYAWGEVDHDVVDSPPTYSALTPGRITALGVGASLFLVAGAGFVALWANQPVTPAPPAVVIETTTTTVPAPPPPPPVTVTVVPPPPPVTVTVQTPAPAAARVGATCSPHEQSSDPVLVCVDSSSAGGWVWVENEY